MPCCMARITAPTSARSMKRFHAKRSPYRQCDELRFWSGREGCASDREGTWITRSVVKPTIAFTNWSCPPLKSGVKMSLSAVCTAWPRTYFVASPCSAGWKMRLKRRFWYSVRNLSVMAVAYRLPGQQRSRSIAWCAKFTARDYLNYRSNAPRTICRIISGYHGACFHHKNECFRHFLLIVIIAVAELVTLITPLPIKIFRVR